MKLFSLPCLLALCFRSFTHVCLILLVVLPSEGAFTFKKAPAANIDLSDLGRTAFAGDFTGISIYQYEDHEEIYNGKNGSQSLYSQMPDGRFANVVSSDAGIQAMCLLQKNNGNHSSVIVGGDFTDLGGTQSPGAAVFDPNTSTVQPLIGLSGQVSALLCDQSTNTVYAGGKFKSESSMNAVKWVGTDGWKDLPFGGFNGPVTSITKASNGNIVFGGSFTGLSNATGLSIPDQIVINTKDARITAMSSTPTPGFSDPGNILCKTAGQDGPGNTWLLADKTPGFWRADFGFTFQPTRLRLWNTHQDGRGTKIFRYTALPINGIMNLSYIDPSTNQNSYCSSECPLSNNNSIKFQDFYFVNVIGMNAFQIDVSDWYGNGGGFSGIELTHSDIDLYAINAFNEPACSKTEIGSTVALTGPWAVSPSSQSSSEYLAVTSQSTDSASIVFLPNIRQSGNYSVNIYTPGCIQDNTCSSRGRVNITGIMRKETVNEAGFSTEIFQTNNYDKYDQIYFGHIDASSSSFRPSVTIKLALGQDAQNIKVVAQRVGFTLVSSGGGLNGLFEYDPNQTEFGSFNFTQSYFNTAGKDLDADASIKNLQTVGDITFVGGNFTKQGLSNIFKITSKGSQSLAGDGLNGEVQSIFVNESILFVGGSFSNTITGDNFGLNNIAFYDTSKNVWGALGAGVNGAVRKVVPLQMNITRNKPEITIALSGDFTQVLGFDDNPPVPAAGMAIWIPSLKIWLENIDSPKMKFDGNLNTAIKLPDGAPLFAGSVSSSQVSAVDVAEINDSGSSLKPLQPQIRPSMIRSSRTVSKQVLSGTNATGVTTGLFYSHNSHSLVILGGHFTIAGPNGTEVDNLAFIDGSSVDTVTGTGSSISTNSTIFAMSIHSNTLFAGGSLTGSVNDESIRGLISYDLPSLTFGTQPPSLDGEVYSISTRRSSSEVYVGGNFSSAGSLSCPTVCQYSTKFFQWNRPGNGIGGVANTMLWATPSSLIVGGKLTLDNVAVSLVNYNPKTQNWTNIIDSNKIPGPVSSIAQANVDASQFWVSGLAENQTAFLMKFDVNTWTSISHLLGPGTQIKGLQVLRVNNNHASSSLVSSGSILLATGYINLPNFGIVSAILFNGTAFQPYILTSLSDSPGSLSQLFTEKDNNFQPRNGKLSKGFVVLISLAIALALIMVIVVSGLLVERLRKREEGYSPAPTSAFDRGNPITTRVPPDQLFGSVSQGGRKAIEKQAALI